jgi:chorismate mutase
MNDPGPDRSHVEEERRLEEVRADIGAVDDALVDLLARRLSLAREIGRIKRLRGLPVMDPAREAEVVRRAAAVARERGVDPELVRAVLWRIIDQARFEQTEGEGGGEQRR